MRGRGSFAATTYQNLINTEQDTLIAAVDGLIVSLAGGVFYTEPERDSDNAPLRSLPACLPHQFAKMTPAHFVEVIISFRPRLKKLFGSQYIDDLETEQRYLRMAYQ
jgi:hypothetical protein